DDAVGYTIRATHILVLDVARLKPAVQHSRIFDFFSGLIYPQRPITKPFVELAPCKFNLITEELHTAQIAHNRASVRYICLHRVVQFADLVVIPCSEFPAFGSHISGILAWIGISHVAGRPEERRGGKVWRCGLAR